MSDGAGTVAGWLDDPVVHDGRGLEIGPLDKPRLAKDRYRVHYVDHASTEDLRQKYAADDAMRDHLDDIVDVDYVWTGAEPLAEVVGDAAPFDYVFASHVAEHAPDLIGWLDQIAAVLGEDGRLYLALPDKRLCFDVNRDLTTMADLVDAHLRGLTAPGFRQIYDFHSRMIAVDAAAMWAGSVDYTGVERTDVDPDQWAYELCLKHQQTGEYVDGHCQVFTPASFLDLYARLVRARPDRLPDRGVPPVRAGHHRVPGRAREAAASLPAEERRARSWRRSPPSSRRCPPPRPDPSGAVVSGWFPVSPREASVIRAKRRLAESVRRLVSRGRSGGAGTA